MLAVYRVLPCPEALACRRGSGENGAMSQPATPFIETKHTLDGRVQRFTTRLLVRQRGWAVVRFDFTGATYMHAGGFSIPTGSYTTGFFWRDRTYNLYHITRADGTPIADRFDVVDAVHIGRDGLSFTDLMLDLWVSPLGEARFEDEDEVRAFHERGLLSDRQLLTVERTGRYLARNHQRVIGAALAALRLATGTAG